MEEKELKTSPKQRVVIILIAILMLGSMIASYAAIVLGNGIKSSGTGEISDEKIAEYQAVYEEQQKAFKEVASSEYATFMQFKEKIVPYDEEAANSGGVKYKERLVGTGKTLTEGDTDYLAFYVGWCAEGNIFDASYDNIEEPTGFGGALDPSGGLIEGWSEGMIGMKLGGIREITIPGEKAYGDSMDICGGTNKPLKFLVMAVENKEPLTSAAAVVEDAYTRLQYAYYGIDYNATE